MEPSSAPWRILDSPDPGAASPSPEPGAAPGRRDLPWAAIGLALAAVAIAIAAIVFTSQPEPVVGVEGAGGFDAQSAWPASPSPAIELVVDVGGAVLRPGVYRLPGGSRVADAIAAAGGYGASADAAQVDLQLNLAAVVRDGDKVRVPARGEAVPVTGGGGAVEPGGGSAGGALVDLNTASADSLDTLPGVGPATAAKIITARDEQPFATVDDLLARKVVGAATLEKLRPLVRVGP